MALVPATCTQCGASIEVDDNRDAGICKCCGNAFVTEKAINYYRTGNMDVENDSKVNIGGFLFSKEQADFLYSLVRNGSKIQAIKEYREMTGYGLKEAKETIDSIDDRMAFSDKGNTSAINSYNNGVNASKKSGGCYIATCVYGSYDCPQVWTLRRFRDHTLDTTWYGRLFIKCYYAISPIVVKLFGRHKWFKMFWKNRLDRMVSKLNKQGVDDSVYKDKY